MSNNIVPRSDLSHDLGTTKKRWGNVYAKNFVGTSIEVDSIIGKAKEYIDGKATQEELTKVKNSIEGATSPCYYVRSEAFSTEDRVKIKTPSALWLNINDVGYKSTESITLNVNEESAWDSKATAWEASKPYAVGAYMYQNTQDKYMYKCTTSGTSSTLTPSLPTTVGETYNDGSIVWECVLNYANAENRAGKDFYMYALATEDSLTPTFVLSANSTVPIDSTADNSRKIGGFHCLCLSVGTISGHKLSGYETGDILPASVYDLNHRAVSANEGMVYDEDTGIWVDIYLSSYTGTVSEGTLQLESKFGGVIADGASTEKFHWYKGMQYLSKVKKDMPSQREFMSFSTGSNQGTNIVGSTDPNTTGGHTDTAGRRMVSDIGCEDCCGVLWQWGRERGAINSGTSWANAYDTNDSSEQKGQHYAAPTCALLGAAWGNGVNCGSRGSNWGNLPLYLNGSHGLRGVASSHEK